MSTSELEAMHTGSLLSRLQHLRECEESLEHTDLTQEEINELEKDESIHVKSSEKWKKAYNELKVVLNERENVPSSKERKDRRTNRVR